MEQQKPFRVGLVQNFPHEDPSFTYFDTQADAIRFMKHMKQEGFQSEQAGNDPGNPNLAVLERWDADEQDWFFVVT
ncbi:MAG: hypothetical protein FWE98_05840 [Oscillospiraceae bacterium]|nr:hypothetical protein [Oscillospiraceae bacterium]